MYSSRTLWPNWSKLKFATVGILTGSIVLYNPIRNTIAADYFVKKSFLISEDNKIVTLPIHLHQFADDVRMDVRIKEKSKASVKFFLTKELDVTPIGNLNMSYGARIGIPYNFNYEKVEDVDPNVISSIIGANKLKQEDWFKTENGKKLINSLVLSKEARKFAIAKGIMAADSEVVIYKDLSTAILTFVAASSYEYLEARTISLIGKFPAIVALGTILTVVFASFLMVGYEVIGQYCEKLDDARALQHQNEDYRKGAIEYYEKLIEKNKSLRGLLVDGPERFDADGNPISWYQINLSPIKERLENCKEVIDTWLNDTPIL